jgi:hypothetical protein
MSTALERGEHGTATSWPANVVVADRGDARGAAVANRGALSTKSVLNRNQLVSPEP